MEIPGETYTHIRQYSLSDAPGKPYYRISVKREDGAAGRPEGKVSVYLHNHIDQGDILWLSAPAGEFTLDQLDSRPVVLISGGVGLTPLVSMLNTIAETNPSRPITFIHAALHFTPKPKTTLTVQIVESYAFPGHLMAVGRRRNDAGMFAQHQFIKEQCR
jgi:nitric oxide dioxygenase